MAGWSLPTAVQPQGTPGHRTSWHPAIADIINRFDKDSVPNAGDAWVFDQASGLYKPGTPSETVESITATTATTVLDLSKGFTKFVTLGVASTTFSITNPLGSPLENAIHLFIKQDATGGRTWTWWPAIKWGGGGAIPTGTPAANSVDRYGVVSVNGGANWFGDIIDLDYK